MARKVDVKALVSHILIGDGEDKCRICMGDTTDGQVFLEDTVMEIEDRSVTLAEVLETITGVEVPLDPGLPTSVCSTCSSSAVSAADFQSFCQDAVTRWNTTVQLLQQLPSHDHSHSPIYAVLNNNELSIVNYTREEHKPSKCLVPRRSHVSEHQRFKYNKRKKLLCQCPDCGKRFLYAYQLYLHLRSSMNNSRACYICAEIMTRDGLITHLRELHRSQPHACKKCPAMFNSLKQYLRHCRNAHIQGKCVCGDCGLSFKSLYAYNAHQSVHSKKVCPSCDKVFVNRKCYFYHTRLCCKLDKNREDTLRTKHKISIMVKNERSEQKVRVGLRGSVDLPVICDYCNKRYAQKKSLVSHIQIVHTKETHRPCEHCGKQFAAAHMPVHLKVHEQKAIYTCEHCGLSLKTKLGYAQHIRLHTGERPYPCQYCDESFTASSRRSEHVKSVHKPENMLKQECTICTAKFHRPSQLKRHLEVHKHMEDDYLLHFECAVCSIRFKSYRSLLSHSKRTHEGKEASTCINSGFFKKVYGKPTKDGTIV